MIKKPVSVSSSRNILQAIEIMKINKVDSLLIVDKSNVLIGLVTLKDIKRSTAKETKLEEIMERNVLSVYEDDNILNILELINSHAIGYIPVITKDNHLAGLVTRSSLISVLSEQFLDTEELSNE